jgi:hypothetical protein
VSARVKLVRLSKALDGVGAGKFPHTYRDYVAPFEAHVRAVAMMQMSGCALLVRGLWRHVGIRHPILMEPYRDQRAVSDLVEIAEDSYAMVPVNRVLPTISDGDAVIVGGPEYGGEWHVWTVLDTTARDYPERGTHLIRGLDGGQKDAQGLQKIEIKTHEITGSPPIDGGRRVRWVIDFDAVWRKWGTT